MEAGSLRITLVLGKPWFNLSLLTGVLLIIGFNLYAWSARKAGVALTAIAGRMSVIIPVMAGFMFFKDQFTYFKIVGIVLALIAVYYSFKKGKGSISIESRLIHYPVLLFLSQGITDTILKLGQQKFINNDFALFLTIAFSVAMICGIIVLIFKPYRRKFKFRTKNLIAGILLGLFNWGSAYFFLKAMITYEITILVPIISVSVVVLSVLSGYFLFREKLTSTNIFGIVVAILAILLLSR